MWGGCLGKVSARSARLAQGHSLKNSPILYRSSEHSGGGGGGGHVEDGEEAPLHFWKLRPVAATMEARES